MTKTQQYEVDFINSKIILTKKFYKAATILNTPEYTTLMQLRRDNPGFAIELREIKKKEGKKSYRNLTYEYMEDYILTHGSAEDIRKNLAEYEELLLLSECHSRSRRYPAIKRWFLEMYPEVVSYGSAEERPKILQIGEKRAS